MSRSLWAASYLTRNLQKGKKRVLVREYRHVRPAHLAEADPIHHHARRDGFGTLTFMERIIGRRANELRHHGEQAFPTTLRSFFAQEVFHHHTSRMWGRRSTSVLRRAEGAEARRRARGGGVEDVIGDRSSLGRGAWPAS